jgi:hypothetical protein
VAIITFCISALETEDLEKLSRLSLRISVMADVMASACLVGTPYDSNFLTCGHHLWLIRSGKHFSEHLSDIVAPEREERQHSREPQGGEMYQGEGVDEDGMVAVGLD